MRFYVRVLVGVVVFGLLAVSPAPGQKGRAPADSAQTWHEDAWTDVVRRGGVRISYIYYPEADNEHDGIVLRLENETNGAVRYAFTLIFRAPEADSTVSVQGTLEPGQMKTGEGAGLFWIPFKDEDYHIGEIGLRGLEVIPLGHGSPARPESLLSLGT